MRLKISITLALIIGVIGCSSSQQSAEVAQPVKPTITETSLGLRKTDIYTEKTTIAIKTEYTGMQPGESEKFDRAYVNAPPMIPHSVEGLIPIEAGNNACTGCHMPEVAKYMDPMPTPIPKTHFTNWRPKVSSDGKNFTTESDVIHSKTFSRDLKGELYKGRYNCTQCHAPQSQGNLAVENTFEGDFSSDNLKHSSNLINTLNEGVKDLN